MPTAPPCRLYAIMARNARRAVILRRGPSKRVQLILWHTDTDRFEMGQWLKGRIYERRCDLSPSGNLFVYFAAKHKGPFGSWTAISHPPYLTALALWPKEDCWDGGGLFESENSIWLNHPDWRSELKIGSLPADFMFRCKDDNTAGEDFPILDIRMRRDGWTTLQDLKVEKGSTFYLGLKTIAPLIRSKTSRDICLIDSMSLTGWEDSTEYVIEAGYNRRITLTAATWADFDQAGRLVFARAGKILRAEMNGTELVEHELADFNNSEYVEMQSPEWAKHW